MSPQFEKCDTGKPLTWQNSPWAWRGGCRCSGSAAGWGWRGSPQALAPCCTEIGESASVCAGTFCKHANEGATGQSNQQDTGTSAPRQHTHCSQPCRGGKQRKKKGTMLETDDSYPSTAYVIFIRLITIERRKAKQKNRNNAREGWLIYIHSMLDS